MAAIIEPRFVLTADELRRAYTTACRTRAFDETIPNLLARGVKFSISGPGEEVASVALALAAHKVTGGKNVFLGPHYRSFTLCAMLTELLGRPVDWVLDTIRQQYSRATDPFSGGVQMVQHVADFRRGILTSQSEVGPNLVKAAGHALAMKHDGITDGLVIGVVGDGTTATGEFTESLAAANLFDLPLLVVVTDNDIAISTKPQDGRTIKSLKKLAEAYGLEFFSCDGRSFNNTYKASVRAASYVRTQQRGAVLHIRRLPRLNGHSSAADFKFDPDQPDPMLTWGRQLVRSGVLSNDEIFTRKETPPGSRSFFDFHNPGTIIMAEKARVDAWIEQVVKEPEPEVSSITKHIRAEIRQHHEPPGLWEHPLGEQTEVPMNAAIRAALRDVLADSADTDLKLIYGQDVEMGVFRATMGLKNLFPDNIRNSPINESLIMWLMIGYGMYTSSSGRRARGFPEIQFGDYAYHAMHCFRYLGMLNYIFRGRVRSRVLARMCVEPFGGGANYHSMSMSELARIPGLVVVTPSTSYDAYGLVGAATEYDGPVVMLEPKGLYRVCHGPALPGEQKLDWLRGDMPTVTEDVRVPIGKAAVRRKGDDITIVAWGYAVHKALEVADELAQPDPDNGRENPISVEVIDLRTLAPWDRETVLASARHTGRLLVVAEDTIGIGFQDVIAAEVAETCGRSVAVARCGAQRGIPAVPHHLGLEAAVTLSKHSIRDWCERMAQFNFDTVFSGKRRRSQ